MMRAGIVPVSAAALSALCLLLLQLGEGSGWLLHGPPPPGLSLLAWGILFVAAWTLMTGAMMLPSSLPFLRAAETIGGTAASTAAAAGFIGVWALVGVLLCAAFFVLGGLLATLPPGGIEAAAGFGLMAAGAYQLGPLAQSCQQACAQPFAIFARHWHGARSRHRDGLAAGIHYGVSCVGCCIPMIAVMLVVGMSDLFWIFGLALMMIVLKHAAWGPYLRLPAAAALAAAGVAIAAGWWTVPLHSLRYLCAS